MTAAGRCWATSRSWCVGALVAQIVRNRCDEACSGWSGRQTEPSTARLSSRQPAPPLPSSASDRWASRSQSCCGGRSRNPAHCPMSGSQRRPGGSRIQFDESPLGHPEHGGLRVTGQEQTGFHVDPLVTEATAKDVLCALYDVTRFRASRDSVADPSAALRIQGRTR